MLLTSLRSFTSLDGLRTLPPVRATLKARFERAFPTPRGTGSLCGEHASFAAAAAAAPTAMPLGYDVQGAATLYRDRMSRVRPKDYAALYWLAREMPHTERLFDIGGHVGIMYFAYQRYLDFRSHQQWTVCDVPAVVDEGRTLAAQRGAGNLHFTTALEDVAGSDVVLATGSLQYIERPIADLLAAQREKPRMVVINETPTHDQREIITLQNIGVAICPYRIARFGDVVASMEAIGYQLVDSWEDPTRRTQIAYVTEPQSIAYSGFCFRLAGADRR